MANLLDKASIVLTPTGYSEDVIHNVKPSESPFGDMGLIKNGTSTRVNSEGLVETVASHTPRIDYSKGEGAILVELVGTNQLSYTQTLTQSSVWSIAGVYPSPVSMVDPTGGTSSVSNIFRYSSASNAGTFQSAASASTGQGVGLSAWVYNPDGGTQQVWIGYGNVGSGNGSFHSVTNSWKRITHITTGSVQPSEFHIAPAASSNLRVWGCQFEKESGVGKDGKVSSYMPSLGGGTGTRSRDNYANGGDAALIGQTEGVFYFEGASLYDAIAGRGMALSDGTAANRVVIYFDFASQKLRGTIRDGGGANIAITGNVTDQTAFNKVAFKYKSGDVALWINGTEAVTSTSTFSFTSDLNELAFDQGNGAVHLEGFIKQVVVFKEILTDAELTALTS